MLIFVCLLIDFIGKLKKNFFQFIFKSVLNVSHLLFFLVFSLKRKKNLK